MIKAVERLYVTESLGSILKFVIKKINSKKYNSMTEQDRLAAILFIEDCEKDLKRFKDDLISSTNN